MMNLEASRRSQPSGWAVAVTLLWRCGATADDVDILIRTAVERFGRSDVSGQQRRINCDATMRTMTEEQFDQVIAVHPEGKR